MGVPLAGTSLSSASVCDDFGCETFNMSICSSSSTGARIMDGDAPRFGNGDADVDDDELVNAFGIQRGTKTAELLKRLIDENQQLRSAHDTAEQRIAALEDKHRRFLEEDVFDLINAARRGSDGSTAAGIVNNA